MICNHVERTRTIVLDAQGFRDSADQVCKQIDVIIAVHTLHHGSNALEAHAGVNRRLRQWHHFTVSRAVELHEHQIPDLDETVALFVRRTRRPTCDLGAVIVKDLAARPTGPGVAHRPIIVLFTHA